ncbi:hypothetical protein TGAM01_v210110 [Trichoderma gamsii]|uniref:Uncharacterized protein n=1 Tax=Trichoderma gamsii TaxID=398673 RepID=A0A2P4Z9V1_9HYPO|nr:hypothetical protein TGAM01_v210110 [Trichoderma gamsii]PON21042.1 hypothetical protein TGAM01_v210110 [Trichoderma gamsii]
MISGQIELVHVDSKPISLLPPFSNGQESIRVLLETILVRRGTSAADIISLICYGIMLALVSR